MNKVLSFVFVFISALLFFAGCTTTSSIEFGAEGPLIRFTNNGLMFQEQYVTPKEAVELLEKYQIPKGVTLHLLVDRDYTDTRATWVFQRNFLARAGYTKSVLVYARRKEAMSAEDDKPTQSPFLSAPVRRHTKKSNTVNRSSSFNR